MVIWNLNLGKLTLSDKVGMNHKKG